MIVAFKKYIYLLLLLLLPTQFGKHFWPSFALVNGLRLDYLSPTLYITDLLVLSLVILIVWQLVLSVKNKELSIRHAQDKRITNYELYKNTILTTLFFLFLMGGIVVSKNPLAGWYGLVKLLEMGLVGWYTANFLGKTVSYKAASVAMMFGMVFESSLAIAQTLLHGSVGSIFYFFGERDFAMTTPGVANASIHGQLFLRPYGTLPHPNVLAAFLLLGLMFSFGQWVMFSKKQKLFFSITTSLAVLALFLTLSRTTIVLFFVLLGIVGFRYVFKNSINKKAVISVLFGVLFLATLLLVTPVGNRLLGSSTGEESVLVREDLAMNAIWMIQTHPLFGVGLQNFFNNLPASLSTRAYYTQMQPVHNIFLLVFAQGGIFVGVLFLYFLSRTGLSVWQVKSSLMQKVGVAMLGSVLFLGLFDHYFLTLQQGQLLFAFVIGYCYSFQTPKAKKRKTKYNKTL